MNKATTDLIPRLVEAIQNGRKAAIDRIDYCVQTGDLDRAKMYADGYKDGSYDLVVRRPRKIRVATMEAAIEYLTANKPAGVATVTKSYTYQTNGNVDYYMRVTFSDIPAFSSFLGPEAAIRMAYDAMHKRDEADRMWAGAVDSYYTMKETVMATMNPLANLLVMLRNDKDSDKDRRRQIQSLMGQLRRDTDYTNLNTPDEDLGYLQQSASSLASALRYIQGNDEVYEGVSRAYDAIHAFRSYRKRANNMRQEAMEFMDKADEFEQQIRSGSLATA